MEAPEEIYLVGDPALGCDAWQWVERVEPGNGLPTRYVRADAVAATLAAAEARATEAAAEAGKWQQRHGELQQELAEQEVKFFDVVKELRRQMGALMLAAQALADCYDVTEWPANGQSAQDVALQAIRDLYSATSQQPTWREGGGRA